MFFHKKSPLKELCLLKYSWDIHNFLKTLLSQCHEVEFCLFVCLHLNHCCVFLQSDVLRVLMIFEVMEVRYFCGHIHLHAYTVMLQTLTALQNTIHDCLNKTLIPNFKKWGGQIKSYFGLPYRYFLPHIRLLHQHLQDSVLQFTYSIYFSFFLSWIYLENEFKA